MISNINRMVASILLVMSEKRSVRFAFMSLEDNDCWSGLCVMLLMFEQFLYDETVGRAGKKYWWLLFEFPSLQEVQLRLKIQVLVSISMEDLSVTMQAAFVTSITSGTVRSETSYCRAFCMEIRLRCCFIGNAFFAIIFSRKRCDLLLI